MEIYLFREEGELSGTIAWRVRFGLKDGFDSIAGTVAQR
jgi:hypothetical protein